MEIGWTDVGSGGYILVSCAHSNIFRHIKSNNSGTAKVKIVKNERDPPLFTGKLLIKFQNILRNTTQVIIRHRVKILFFYPMSYDILSSVSQNVLKFYQQLTGEERRVPFIFGQNNQ
jgi:hypothetical protein